MPFVHWCVVAISIPTTRPALPPPISSDGWWRTAVPAQRPTVFDVLVALALAFYGLVMFTAEGPVDELDLVLLVATCTAMVWRRLAPDVILALNVGLRVLLYVTDGDASYPTWAMSIALFTFVAARPVWAGIVAWAAVTALYVFTPYQAGVLGGLSLTWIVSPAGFFAAALGGGFVVKHQQQLNDELRAAAAEVAASVTAREQMAVMEERNRLRDDLHDIIGHHINVATVLADTAHTAHGRDDARLLASLDGIGTACRSALDEMDRATTWLATTGSDVDPTPSLNDRRGLLGSVRGAGLDVHEYTTLTPAQLAQLDQVVSATAHRFLREALTNVLKHSPQRSCHVALTVEHDTTLALTVTSAAAGAPTRNSAAGTGLHRLRRRVQLFGGTVEAGPDDDRFVQRATFPLRPGP